MNDRIPASPAHLAADHLDATRAASAADGRRLDAFADAVHRLQDATIDMLSVLGALRETAEGGASDVLSDWARTHRRHTGELSDFMLRLGVAPRAGGTWAASIRRGAASARAAVSGVDATTLAGVLRREQRTLEHYADAALAAPDPQARALLERQHADLARLANRTQDLIDGT